MVAAPCIESVCWRMSPSVGNDLPHSSQVKLSGTSDTSVRCSIAVRAVSVPGRRVLYPPHACASRSWGPPGTPAASSCGSCSTTLKSRRFRPGRNRRQASSSGARTRTCASAPTFASSATPISVRPTSSSSPSRTVRRCAGSTTSGRSARSASTSPPTIACATAVILGVLPLARAGVIDRERPIVAEAKVGSSEGGREASEATHHPERSGAGRPRDGACPDHARARREGAVVDLPRGVRGRAVRAHRQGAVGHLPLSRAEDPRRLELLRRRVRARSARPARRRGERHRQPREGRRRELRACDERRLRLRRGRRAALPRPAPMIVVKVGGSAGVDRAAVAADVAALAASGTRIVLVHGASAETDRLSTTLDPPPRTIVSPSGQQSRRTDRRTLEIFAMAALGIETFTYVELLRRAGANAIGLFGVLAGPRKNVRALEGDRVVLLRDDFTGKVERVDAEVLRALLDAGAVPVLPPLALSDDGEGLNVDGDRAAASVAIALRAA